MAQGLAFPAFIRAEYDSGSGGFRDFERSAIEASDNVRRRFDADMAEIRRTVSAALTMPRNAAGGLNLDTAGMRQAAADAQAAAVATRQFAQAAEAAARSSGGLTAETRNFVAAARAEAVAAEEKARNLAQNAAAYERLQVEIDRASVAAGRFGGETLQAASANGRLATSQGALRQASIGAGQQLQDIAISLYSGQRAGVVFAQQLPQLAFALSSLEGSTNKTAASVGRFATFLSGPWGLAVGLGVGAIAMMTSSLFDNADAAGASEKAQDALAKKLADIATFFDLSTGAVLRNNEALIANARLQRLDEIDDIKAAQRARSKEIRGLVTGSTPGEVRFGGTFGNETGRVAIKRSGPSDLVKAIEAASGDQVKIGDALVKLVRSGGTNAERARRILELRAQAGSDSQELRKLTLEEESLRTGQLSSELRNTPTKRTPRTRGSSTSDADKAARAALQLDKAIDQSAESVTRLREQFGEAPRDIARADAAARELDSTLKDVQERLAGKKLPQDQRAKLEQTERDIIDAQQRILPNFRQRPVTDRIEDMDKELQLQRLILGGREDEADLLGFQQDLMRQLRVQTVEQLEAELRGRNISKEKLDLMYAQFRQLRENARVQQRMDRSVRSVSSQLQELDRARSTLEQSIAALPNDARGALKDFSQNIRQQVNDIIARRLADNLFGDLFTRLEGQIRGKRPIDAATEGYVASTTRASTALIDLTNTFIYASGAMRGAANDNIVSIAKGSNVAAQALKPASKSLTTSYDPDAEIVVRAGGGKTNNREQRQINEAMEKSAKSLADLARSAAEGMFIGQTAGSLLFGNKNSATGSAIGGALGKIAGDAIGKTLGGSLGKFAGPLGSIAGGLLGGALGKVFMGTKRGSATIGGSGDVLSVASFGGNSKKFQQAAGTGADSAISTINRIAEMLGADVNAAAGSVSIGIRDGKYRVDTTGRGITKTKKGAIDFGDDAEAAIRAATLDLIRDGVLTGLRASTQRILQTGKDLDAAIQKALDFESVFTRLKEYKDPVGAAIDTLDKEFVRLRKVFQEAGASAQEYAELEELYGIERAKAIKEASERVTSSLKSLYDQLTIGDSGRSLRDRLGAAQAAYDPLRARVMAGDRTAYDDFAKAAQELMEIQRQFSGSQTPYFNLLDEITRLTKERIDAEANITSIAENRDTPFTSSGAAAQNYAPVVGAIDRQTEVLTAGFRALIAANDTGGGGGGRAFAMAPFQ